MAELKLETALTRTVRLLEERDREVRLEEQRQKRSLEEELQYLYEVAMATPPGPMKDSRTIVLAKRGDKYYFRRSPTFETESKSMAALSSLAKMASELTYEEVATLVGGQVVDVGETLGVAEWRGKKGILVDGQVLNKTQAIVKLMKGKKLEKRKDELEKLVRLLKWALHLE